MGTQSHSRHEKVACSAVELEGFCVHAQDGTNDPARSPLENAPTECLSRVVRLIASHYHVHFVTDEHSHRNQ